MEYEIESEEELPPGFGSTPSPPPLLARPPQPVARPVTPRRASPPPPPLLARPPAPEIEEETPLPVSTLQTPVIQRTQQTMTSALEELPEVTVTAKRQSNVRAPRWSEMPNEVQGEIGRRIENKVAGVQEYTGGRKKQYGEIDLWRLQNMARIVKESGERGISLMRHPDVLAAAKEIGVRPDHIVPTDWARYASITPDQKIEETSKAIREIQVGNRRRDEGRARRIRAAEVAQYYMPQFDSQWSPKALVFDAATSAPDLLLGVAAGVVHPAAGAAVMGGSIAPEMFTEGKNQGLSDSQALGYAGLMAAAEVVTEVPLFEVLKGTPAGKRAMRAVAGKYAESVGAKITTAAAIEGTSEAITEALQIGIDEGYFDHNISVGQALEQIARAGVVGAGMGAAIGGVTEGTRAVAEKVTSKPVPAEKPAPRTEPKIETLPDGSAITAQPSATTAQPERRTDTETRKSVSQMSPEELRTALLTNDLSGLPNRRAYEEAPKKPAQASIDIDSLKYVNDNLGHQAGDALLKEAARVLREEGVDAFHISGDEFVVQGEDEAGVRAALDRASERLRASNLELPLESGDKKIFSGMGLSYGIGKDLAEAEAGLQVAKTERERRGERAPRGEPPPAAIEVVEAPRVRAVRKSDPDAVRTPPKDAAPDSQTVDPAAETRLADLEAVEAGSPSPEQITRLTSQKLIAQSETGQPRLLPAGRRILAARATEKPAGRTSEKPLQPADEEAVLEGRAPAVAAGQVPRETSDTAGADRTTPQKPAKLVPGLKSEPGYAYHATNEQNLQDIIESGELRVHEPSHGTDQDVWPDGATEKRSYFSPKAENAYQFAPEDGKPVVLRIKQDARLRRESTGDLYSRKKIPAVDLEYLGEDGAWHPLITKAGSNPVVTGEKTEEFEISGQKIRVNTNPTAEQKQSGEYTKGKLKFAGFDINIENPKGTKRKYRAPDGTIGTRTMKHHYGEFDGKPGADGDNVDVFLASEKDTGRAFIINQIDPKTGEFDEVKVLLGVETEPEARSAYLSNYQKNWNGLGEIYEVSTERLREWLDSRKSRSAYKPKKALFSRASENPTLAARIEAAIEGDAKGPIVIGNTPNALTALGIAATPIVLPGPMAAKMHFDHGLSKTQIMNIVEYLADPLMVFKSDTEAGRNFVILTRDRVPDGPLMISLREKGKFGQHELNVLTSAYGRKEPASIGQWFKKGLLIASARTEALRWVKDYGMDSPEARSAIGRMPETSTPPRGRRPVFSKTAKIARPEPSPAMKAFLEDYRSISIQHPFTPTDRLIGRGRDGSDYATIDLSFWEDGIHISSIQSIAAGKKTGAGSYALKKLTELADKHGVVLNLNAKKFGKIPGQLSTAKLKEWYSRNGFEAAARGSEYMVRQPKKASKPVFSKKDKVGVYYSAVLRAVEGMKLNKASGAQWWNTISKMPGIKPEELQWLGLEDWLKIQSSAISREKVIEFIEANQIKVSEVLYSEKKTSDEKRDELTNLNVRMTAFGYEPFNDMDGETAGIRSIRTGEAFFYDTDQQTWVDEEERPVSIDPEVTEIARRLEELSYIPDGWSGVSGGQTRYGEYTLAGGENYRELLLTLPTSLEAAARVNKFRAGLDDQSQIDLANKRATEIRDRGDYKSGHWTPSNIVAHVRFTERNSSDGKRVLFIEEIQSDWHQAGRKRGYRSGEGNNLALATKRAGEVAEAAKGPAREALQRNDNLGFDGWGQAMIAIKNHPDWKDRWEVSNPQDSAAIEAYRDAWVEYDKAVKAGAAAERKVPDAPFKTTWPELAFKRALRWAAENGFDQVAWTTGQQQNDRYRLQDVIDSIVVGDLTERLGGDRFRTLKIYPSKSGAFLMDVDQDGVIKSVSNSTEEFNGRTVEEVFGENVGRQIRDGVKRISGNDLKIGGFGMIGFYDRMLPRITSNLTKKWGGKVGTTNITPYKTSWMSGKVAKELLDPNFNWESASQKERDELIARAREIQVPVHSIDITPEMRDAALKGFPLFSRQAQLRKIEERRREVKRQQLRSIQASVESALNPYSAAGVAVVQSAADLPSGVKSWLAYHGQTAEDAKGFLQPDTGRIYLIADNLTGHLDAVETAYHELVGHFGLRSMLTAAQYEATMKGIWRDMPDMARKYAKRNGYDLNDPEQYLNAAEEVVAYAAGKILSGQKLDAREMTVWQRVLDVLRAAWAQLRGKPYFNERAIANIVAAASNHMKREAAGPIDQLGRPVFSSKPPLYFSKIWEAVNTTKVPNTAPLAEYQKIIQSKVGKDFGAEEWKWSGPTDLQPNTQLTWGQILSLEGIQHETSEYEHSLRDAERYGAPKTVTDLISKAMEISGWLDGESNNRPYPLDPALLNEIKSVTDAKKKQDGSVFEELDGAVAILKQISSKLSGIAVDRINKEFVLDQLSQYQLTVQAVPYSVKVKNQREIDEWMRKWDPETKKRIEDEELQRELEKKRKGGGHYRDATDEERSEAEETWFQDLDELLSQLQSELADTSDYVDQSDYIRESANERAREDDDGTKERIKRIIEDEEDYEIDGRLRNLRNEKGVDALSEDDFTDEDAWEKWKSEEWASWDSTNEGGNSYPHPITWNELRSSAEDALVEAEFDEEGSVFNKAFEENVSYWEAAEEEYYHGGDGSIWIYKGDITTSRDWDGREETYYVEIEGSDDNGYTLSVDGDRVGAEYYSRNRNGRRTSGHVLAVEAALEHVREKITEDHMPDFSRIEISEEEARILGLLEDVEQIPLLTQDLAPVPEAPPKPEPEIEESVKWESYSLPDAMDYGERLFISNGPEKFRASGHWDGRQNVVAHVRYSTREMADGRKILFLEENQSDWHQQHRENSSRVPEAPVKNWNAMIMKWAIAHANQKGFDGVGISNGAVHGVRWSATQSYAAARISPIEKEAVQYHRSRLDPKYMHDELPSNLVNVELYQVIPAKDPEKTEFGKTGGAVPVRGIITTPDRLSGIIGQDAARAYTNSGKHTETVTLHRSDDLVIWGPSGSDEHTFRRHFGSLEIYDKIALNEINGFLKKYGAKLEFDDMKVSFNPISKGMIPGKSGDREIDHAFWANNATEVRISVAMNKVGVALGQLFIENPGAAGLLEGFVPGEINPNAWYVYDLWQWGDRKGGFNDTPHPDENSAMRAAAAHANLLLNEPEVLRQVEESGLAEPSMARKSARIPVVYINAKLAQSAKETGFPLFSKAEADGLIGLGNTIKNGSSDFSLPEPSTISRAWNYLRYKVQDKFIDLLNTQRDVQRFRGAVGIPDKMDAYLQQTLYHGRAEERIAEFEKQFEDPLIELIKKSGYEWQGVSNYLYARHAPERNKRIREINPDDPSWGSGMTDEEAAQIMRDLAELGDIEKLHRIGEHVDRMTKWIRDRMVMEGLETPETIQAWEETYQHYVPLKGWANESEAQTGPVMPRKGKGFDTGGKLTKAATGRKTRAATILANIGAQARATLVLAEKAKVGRALYDFVKANPAPDYWTIDEVQYTRTVDASTGLVREGVNPMFKLADNVVRVKIDGVDQHITFNAKDERMLRLAAAMKNLSPDQIGPILALLHGFNRYLSMISTSLNPEFVITNALRDVQTALINLSEEEVAGIRRKVIRDWRKAARGIWLGERESPKDHEWKQHWERFKKAGAKVGWIDNYKTPVHLEKHLQRKLGPANKIQWTMDKVRAVGEWVNHMNGSVENAIRLSTFVNLIEAGVNEERAASTAKDLTVNFNRRGDTTVLINSLYLFANASIQGTARFFRFAASKNGMKVMSTIVAAGIGMSLLNRFIGGDDEDGENRYDKIPDSERERNLIVMLPSDFKFNLPLTDAELEIGYIKIPMPYGYNVPYFMGNKLGDYVDYGFIGNKRTINPGADAGSMLGAMMGSWSPIGDTTSIGQFIAPTLADPFIQLDENRAWHGGKIYPDAPYDESPPPDSQQAFGSTPIGYKMLAGWLNEVTGGTEVTPGGIDISPETMQHWVDFAGGGLMRFITSAINAPVEALADPKDLEVRELAFLRRVVGSIGQREDQELFYQHVKEIQYAKQEIDAIYKMGIQTDEGQERLAFVSERYPVATMLAREMYPSFASGRGDEDLDKAAILRRLYQGIQPERPVSSPARPRRGETASLVTRLSRARQEIRRLEARTGLPAEERRRLIEEQRSEIERIVTEFNKRWAEVHDSVYGAKKGRLIGQLGPLLDGKSRRDQVVALRAAGLSATADLISSLPATPDRLALEYFAVDAARS